MQTFTFIQMKNMKTMLTRIMIVALLLVSMEGFGQYVTVQDSTFGAWLSAYYPSCVSGAYPNLQLDTTCPAMLQTTYLNPSSTYIGSSAELIYFKNLDSLLLSYAAPLPILPARLKWLNIASSGIDSLTALPDSLVTLILDYCHNLSYFAPLPGSLKYLSVQLANLDSLPVILPASLLSLNCYGNYFTTLPALPSSLRYLDCSHNQLTSLSSLPTSLTYLNCTDNNLTSLPTLPDSLSGKAMRQNIRRESIRR